MGLSIKKKEEITYELQGKFQTSLSVVVASLNEITANAMNQLRKNARDCGVYVRVVPNSLLRRAVRKTLFECLSKFFVKESVVAFSIDKPSDAAKLFVNFSKDYENFKIKGAAFEGKCIDVDRIDLLSNLPDYEESILRFILILKIISIGKLLRVLQALSYQRK